jgi:hypothetical protein
MPASHRGGKFHYQGSPCGILIAQRRNCAAPKSFSGTCHFGDCTHVSVTIREMRVRQQFYPHLGSTKLLFQI